MPLTPTFSLTAVNCPAPQASGAAIIVSAGDGSTPIVTAAETVQTGMAGLAGTDILARNAGRLDVLGRYGGGAAGAVRWGLTLSEGTGLTLNVAAGQAGRDSGAELAAAATLAMTDNVVNRVWISRAGVLNKVTSASGTPLAPPDSLTPWTFLGAVTTLAGAITQLDLSGVLSVLEGGQVWRRTADLGLPGDTPPSWLRLWTRTAGGVFLWDGGAYWALAGVSRGRLAKVLPDSNYTLTAAEYLNRHLDFTGTLTAGRNVVLPLVDGAEFVIANGTSQTLTAIGATGTGIAVAAGKTAIVRSEGVNILRISADNP